MEVAGEAKDAQNNVETDTPALETRAEQEQPVTRDEQPDASAAPAGAPGLPEAAPAADLPGININTDKRRQALSMALCFTITFLVYLAYIPQFVRISTPPTGDQPFYLMDAISIVQDWDFDVKNNYDNSDYDKFYKLAPYPPSSPNYTGMLAPYPLGRQLTEATARPKTEQYSYHLPGLPLLLAPAWLVGGWFQLWWPATIVAMCLLGSLLCLNVWLLAYEMTGRQWIAWAVWLPIAFSNPVMSYSYLIFTEMPVGLLLIYAFRRLALGWGANGPGRLFLVGLCIGYIPWIAWRCVFITGALALYAAVQWWRHRRVPSTEYRVPSTEYQVASSELRVASNDPSEDSTSNSKLKTQNSKLKTQNSVVWLAMPVILSAALLLGYHFFLFGQPIPSTETAEGRTLTFNWPWAGLEQLRNFMTATFGSLFDWQFGLLTYAPIYLLAFVGIIAMFRFRPGPNKRLLLWMALLTIPYLTLAAAWEAWHGVWCPPARYLVTFTPLMAAPLAISLFALTRSWVPRVIYGAVYGAFALIGAGIMSVLLLDPRLMWPINVPNVYIWLNHRSPEIKSFSQYFLSNFVLPDEMEHPFTSARMIALAAGIVLLCFLLMVFQKAAKGERRLPYLGQGLVMLGSVALLGAGWYGMSRDYLQHKTILVEQRRWDNVISPILDEPYGIAYLDGKVYITSFGRQSKGAVGVLDVVAGTYKLLDPTSAEGPIEFANPSDVKVGPDGLLHVLNNGPSVESLFVMKPDGEIVRKIALEEKSPIATALYMGTDGSYYVADMLGGSIVMYGQDGGEVEQVWKGEGGKTLNNPSGVAADGDIIYALENGNKRLYEFARSGERLRTYNFNCKPVHAVVHGDWVDITCTGGLYSINRKSHTLQLSQFKDSKPLFPTGLAYGPDDTLYVLDRRTPYPLVQGTIIEYKVQH